jgi:cytoskeletal protein RodZ
MSRDRGAGDVLKEARISAGKTLAQMSEETQINARYLGEIEEGGDFSLPEVYRRTFSRTYAKALGVDVEELLEPGEEGDASERGGDEPSVPDVPAGPPVESTTASPMFAGPLSDRSQLRSMAIVVVFLVTALILAVKWLGSGSGDEVLTGSDQTARSRPGENLSAFNQDRQARGAEPSGGRPAADSLVLVAASTESVWVHVVIDNDSAVEYTMPPRYSVTLRAAENFLLAVGNPAGLSISLNGRRLDILGDGNRPKKNILLSRKTLAQ